MKVFKSETARKNVLNTYNQLLDMWDVDKEEKDIATTYGTTHVILCGNENAPPLVLFHGVGDNSALMWLYNAKALSRHFRVIAIDTIGGPGKSCPNTQYTKGFSDEKWIDEIFMNLALTKVNMAGVSNGAYLAQYYGIHRPERVNKIVCMAGTVPDKNFNPMKTMLKVFLPEAIFPTPKNTLKIIRKLTGKNSGALTDNPVIMEHYYFLLKGFNQMAMSYQKIEHFNSEQIESIRGKTIFLVGEEDPFAKLGGKKSIMENKMNVKFFSEVGHGLNHEIAEEINRLIPEFI